MGRGLTPNSAPPAQDLWRKPEPKTKRRRAVERRRNDDLGLQAGQLWRHRGSPYLAGLCRELTIERICRVSVLGPISYVYGDGGKGFALAGQVSFLELRRKWELVEPHE